MKVLVKFINKERGNIDFMKSLQIIPNVGDIVTIRKRKAVILEKSYDLDEEGEIVILTIEYKKEEEV